MNTVTELRPSLPPGILAALQRLYEENPAAVLRFAAAIEEPEHTQSIGLCFVNRRLAYAEFRSTAK